MNVKVRLCPDHRIALKAIKYEGEFVDQCALCGGLWCSLNSIEIILKKRIQKFDKETIQIAKDYNFPSLELEMKKVKVEARKCLECDEDMKKHDFSKSINISIDRCLKGHGVWLDKDEIDRIQVLVEDGK
jgi:Zn-finger nucleic acid-binding protein